MSKCYLTNGIGDSLDAPSDEQIEAFLQSIDWSDEEHGAAWLTDENGNSLELNGDGRLVYTRGDKLPGHLTDCTHEKATTLWKMLASGDLAGIEREEWRPGVCPPEMAERKRKAAETAIRELDRQFYFSLGTENPKEVCSTPNCRRGRVNLSIFCRVHHFESVRKKPCPFDNQTRQKSVRNI